jgi:hypothetical protein
VGAASTGTGFTNLFQFDNDADHATVTATRTDTSPVLPASGTDVSEASYTFATSGTWYARACADNDALWSDTITESNEDNNCGAWTAIAVAVVDPHEPECSDNDDNDGDGLIDYPQDHNCSDPGDDDESPKPECSDGVNNDSDAWTDYPADPGCTSLNDTSENPNPQCSDGADNDRDGLADIADPSCHTDGNPGSPGSYNRGGGSEGAGSPQCSDGEDNDGDGLFDLDDVGCTNGSDTTEAPNPECSDGKDNDRNGTKDYPTDPGCSSALDNNESTPAAALSLNAERHYIKSGTSPTFDWQATSVQPGSCYITGSSYNSDPLSGTQGSVTTKSIVSQSTFVLHCTNLAGEQVSVSDTVNVQGTIEEK